MSERLLYKLGIYGTLASQLVCWKVVGDLKTKLFNVGANSVLFGSRRCKILEIKIEAIEKMGRVIFLSLLEKKRLFFYAPYN